ncbi:DEAD/DEAH box helicase [Meiothermus granaticius]|uniref:Putative helicase HelY n=1 Tax=Meiothermus granaticius NBRC 107808 TaxID=1227551 RepID=A0A399FA53_9DEIN|nr:DEAD/DEAH box helicase [Meiothermus granaticius]MCL6527545.1 DEAD/DEAH box helicase [Thermaceae bacterium]RIH93537.1 putative helicase HelY [Meiothermus granaticius NBRC 107808]GEM86033.1 peptidase C14 [Meiothermus granaticius NBRC 107808]
MPTRAAFIGIDRYADADISDLTGAAQDARALWALFSDNVPDIDARLLIDEKASLVNIEEILERTLLEAAPDDTVILSFSGHGSDTHHLVPHDAMFADVPGSCLPMSRLAELFRSCQAKQLLLILDCCFSGGAPARVVHVDARVRSFASQPGIQSLVGEGRVILAACAEDEEALEVAGHGLLTRSFFQTLMDSEEAVNIFDLVSRIAEEVHAEAARRGHQQRPVILGAVVGGLLLPRLLPGAQYQTLFPSRIRRKISAAFDDLMAYNFPASIIDRWKDQYPNLNSLQVQAVNDFGLLDGDSLLVVAPTSSGKTFIGELALARAVSQGKKAVFLVPLRALVAEKYEQFEATYGQSLGLRVRRVSGDYADEDASLIRGKYDLAVLTYEMFLGLALNNPKILNDLGLVVLDEAHMLTDPGRGVVVELILSLIRSRRELEPQLQLVALSAVIGDLNHFHEWLGVAALVSSERPVPLVEGVLDRRGIYYYKDPVTGQAKQQQLIEQHRIIQRGGKSSAQDVLVPLLSELLKDPKEQVLVFRNVRGSAMGSANYLSQDLGLPPASSVIEALPQDDMSEASVRLRACLQGGTAFHTSDLSREERAIIEAAFRQKDSPIRVMTATTTLAAGVNTPATTVILAETEFMGEDGRAFRVAEVKNMAGRAGRLGIKDEGRAIILAEHDMQVHTLLSRYVMQDPEPMHSTFDPNDLETWVLRMLAQVGKVSLRQGLSLLSQTYGGYLLNRNRPDWAKNLELRLSELVKEMEQAGLVETFRGELALSALGGIAANSSLSYNSILRLLNIVRDMQPLSLSVADLLALAQVLPEMDAAAFPSNVKYEKDRAWKREVFQRVGNQIHHLLSKLAGADGAYDKRCKALCVLLDWIEGQPMGTIENRYYINPFARVAAGDVRSLSDRTRFHLRPVTAIVTHVRPDISLPENMLERLLQRLEYGLPDDSLELLKLRLLTRGEVLWLRERGILGLAQLATLTDSELTEVLGREKARRLQGSRPCREALSQNLPTA